MSKSPRILLVTNVLTHYRKPLFMRMAEQWNVQFLFYSDGREWYWQGGTLPTNALPAKQLGGFWIAGTRIAPALLPLLMTERFDVLVQGAIGRFALPVGFAAARARRKPIVLWTGIWRRPDSIAHRLGGGIYRRADAVVTYGKHVSRFAIDQGADPRGVFEAPQAISYELFSAKQPKSQVEAARALAGGRPIILYVGRLEPWKGPQILIEGLKELARRGQDFTGIFIGNGSMKEELQVRSNAAGLEGRIIFLDHQANDELPAYYQAAHVVVIPSVADVSFNEPWSLVANEALAAGTLVLASDAVGAVQDGLLTHLETGLVFAQSNVEELADRLETSLVDQELSLRLVSNASHRIRQYTYTASIQGFEKAIRFAVDGSRRST